MTAIPSGPVSSVGAVGAAGTSSMTSTAPTRTPKQEMDSEVFMSLLVTQLKNQDPSSPMDTNAMIGQSTQLAMMEKLTQLATDSAHGLQTQQRAAAAALLGRTVSYLGADGATATGAVSGVTYGATAPTVTIGSVSVPIDSITTVTGG